MSTSQTHYTKRVQDTRGFTLVEVVITVAILVIITSVILVQSTRSRSELILTNEAYEVALVLREAQSFGIAVRETDDSSLIGNARFDLGYGMNLDIADLTKATLFNDTDRNGLFEGGDQVAQEFFMSRGNRIQEFCVNDGATETCSGGGLTKLHVVFVRPNPDAKIRADNDASTPYQSARIDLISTDGDTKRITVFSTGQIAVED